MNRDKIMEITKKNACEISTNTNTIHSSNIPPSSIKRINVCVDEDIDLLFRKLASQKFKFNRGWYSQAMTEAMELWIKYNKALKIDSNNTIAWFNKGIILAKLEKDEEASESFDKSLEIDSNMLEAWGNKGIALNNLKKHEEALKCFNKVLKLDSTDINGWYNKGYTLMKLKKNQEALKSLNNALKLEPNFEPALKAKEEVLKLMKN